MAQLAVLMDPFFLVIIVKGTWNSKSFVNSNSFCVLYFEQKKLWLPGVLSFIDFFFPIDLSLFSLSKNLLVKANIICEWSQIIHYEMTEYIYNSE